MDEKPSTPTLPTLFDWLRSINETKENLYDRDDIPTSEMDRSYNKFMVGRFLSHSPDTIAAAAAVNRTGNMPQKWHYDFLRMMVRKRKRYVKLPKPSYGKEIAAIMEYYGCSTRRAVEYANMMSDDRKAEIVKIMDLGG